MAAVTSDVVTLRARPRAEAPRSAEVIGWTAPRWFTPCFLASTDAAALVLAIAPALRGPVAGAIYFPGELSGGRGRAAPVSQTPARAKISNRSAAKSQNPSLLR